MDSGRRLDGGEVDQDVVNAGRHEGHQESHRDQVDGNHLPGCLQNLCIDIKTLRLGLWLLLTNAWNSVKHVGIQRLPLHLDDFQVSDTVHTFLAVTHLLNFLPKKPVYI